MRTLALTLLAIVLGISPAARAGIISRDLEALGDGLLTYDMVNQREWLDLPETIGMTLAEVMSQTVPNGRLEGFRFATLADVSGLAASAEVGWTSWSLPFNVEPNVPEFVELLGWVVRSQGGTSPEMRVSLGLIATDNAAAAPTFDDTNFYVVSMPVTRGVSGPTGLTLIHTNHGGVFASAPIMWGPDFSLGMREVGPFWLYRVVPEPRTILFLMQSLAGFIAVRRWRPRVVGPTSRWCA